MAQIKTAGREKHFEWESIFARESKHKTQHPLQSSAAPFAGGADSRTVLESFGIADKDETNSDVIPERQKKKI